MEKVATRSQKGLAGVRAYLKSQERKAIKCRQERGLQGLTTDEIVRTVFDEVITLEDRNSFTPTAGKIYGGMVKRLYDIERIRSVYEGWAYVAQKLTLDVCGDGAVVDIGDTKWGVWYLRDKSAEYVFEKYVREQLEILTGRTFA